jgi:hypothetical protein
VRAFGNETSRFNEFDHIGSGDALVLFAPRHAP